MKIWEFSTSSTLTTHLRQLSVFEERAYTGLLEGRYTMETSSVSEPFIMATVHRIAASGANTRLMCSPRCRWTDAPCLRWMFVFVQVRLADAAAPFLRKMGV